MHVRAGAGLGCRCDHGGGCHQALRFEARRRPPRLHRSRRRRHRLPRPQRLGQEHHHALHAGPRPGRERHHPVRRPAVPFAAPAVARGRRPARCRLCAPRPQRPQPPALDGGEQRHLDEARRRGARTRRPHCRRRQPGAQVLPRHAAAPGPRRGVARRAAHGDPRRAGQRPRPRGHPLDPRRAHPPRRAGLRGTGQQPPAVGDLADGRRPDRDRSGPAHRAVHRHRLHRTPRGTLGEGAVAACRRIGPAAHRRRRHRRPGGRFRRRHHARRARHHLCGGRRTRRGQLPRAPRAVAADRLAGGCVLVGHGRRAGIPLGRTGGGA